MGLSNVIPQLKEEIPQGAHDCVIHDVRVLQDSEGKPIHYLASACVVFSFSCNSLVHEKLFRLGDVFEYKFFKKLLSIIGIPKEDIAFNKNDVINKKVCVIIQKVTNTQSKEISFKVANFKPVGKNYKNIISEIYI